MLQNFPILWTHENEQLVWLLASLASVLVVSSCVFIPLVIVRLPDAYFTREYQQRKSHQHPLSKFIMMLGKNILGVFFVIVGIFMLLLPGQGLLMILSGIILLNFPGKHKTECWLIQKRPILLSVNWLRHRFNQPPLIFD